VSAYRLHGIIDIREPDLAISSHLFHEQCAQVSGTTGNVEHLAALPDAACLHGKTLPQSMQPSRHKIIHQVIAFRNRIKYIRNFARFLCFRNFIEAEMGNFSHGCSLPIISMLFSYITHANIKVISIWVAGMSADRKPVRGLRPPLLSGPSIFATFYPDAGRSRRVNPMNKDRYYVHPKNSAGSHNCRPVRYD